MLFGQYFIYMYLYIIIYTFMYMYMRIYCVYWSYHSIMKEDLMTTNEVRNANLLSLSLPYTQQQFAEDVDYKAVEDDFM